MKKVKILNANGLPYHHAKKNLDDMTPAERIEAVRDLDRASVQYRKQITEKFMAYIKMERNRKNKDTFVITAKCGILNTMSPAYLEKFIKRLDRIATISEGYGYEVKFNKWRSEKEYGWFFDIDNDVYNKEIKLSSCP